MEFVGITKILIGFYKAFVFFFLRSHFGSSQLQDRCGSSIAGNGLRRVAIAATTKFAYFLFLALAFIVIVCVGMDVGVEFDGVGAVSLEVLTAVAGAATFVAVMAGLSPPQASAAVRAAVHDAMLRRAAPAGAQVAPVHTDVGVLVGFECCDGRKVDMGLAECEEPEVASVDDYAQCGPGPVALALHKGGTGSAALSLLQCGPGPEALSLHQFVAGLDVQSNIGGVELACVGDDLAAAELPRPPEADTQDLHQTSLRCSSLVRVADLVAFYEEVSDAKSIAKALASREGAGTIDAVCVLPLNAGSTIVERFSWADVEFEDEKGVKKMKGKKGKKVGPLSGPCAAAEWPPPPLFPVGLALHVEAVASSSAADSACEVPLEPSPAPFDLPRPPEALGPVRGGAAQAGVEGEAPIAEVLTAVVLTAEVLTAEVEEHRCPSCSFVIHNISDISSLVDHMMKCPHFDREHLSPQMARMASSESAAVL